MRDLVFMPSFSLQPNKVVSFNSIFVRDKKNETLKGIREIAKTKAAKFSNVLESNQIKRASHNFTLSDNANRTLKKKISWLYYLAKSKQVKTYNGNSIFNFKIGFITLTLPSKQRTPTISCNSDLLNVFLTEIRQRTKMENYVWRLEFQKNGNVHYHLVTDTYIDYYLVLKIWNKILKNNGYIEDYQSKMSKLSLMDYNKIYNSDGKKEFSVIAKQYAKGKSDNWENPNSVDVKSVISNKSISNYISKYFAKDSKHGTIKNDLDTDENSKNLRLWFCSRSLSKLNAISDFCEAVTYDIFAIVSYCKDVKKVIGKYATSIYFEMKNFEPTARKWIEMILKKYASDNNYQASS